MRPIHDIVVPALLTAAILAMPRPAEAQSQPPREGERPLMVGLMRIDCVALPFAYLEGPGWTPFPEWNPPEALVAWGGPWHYLSRSGDTARIRTGEVVDYGTGGSSFYEYWGLRTDHGPCTESPHSYPVERTGVILSDPVRAVALRSVHRDDPLRSALGEVMGPAFGEREEAMLRRLRAEDDYRARFGYPADPAVRAETDPALVELHAGTFDGETLIYFVARRSYEASGMGSGPLAVLHGWAVDQGRGVRILDAEMMLDAGSEQLIETYTPFAIFDAYGHRIVVVEKLGWESSEKTLLRWGPDGVEEVM